MKFVRFLLFPLAILYDLVTTVRNFLFEKEILKSTKFKIPIIAVGNLSVGGTGKTPQIEYLIRLLQKEHKVAVLSRGYKRKTKGFIKLDKLHTAEDVGDEPLQFFKKFNELTVAVDADRTNGIQQLITSKNPPNVVLLDDAFQHRKVNAGLYILLTKYDDLYIDDFILPSGNLRESSRGAKRANLIVVTKCPESLSQGERRSIRTKLRLQNEQQLFFSSIVYSDEIIGSNKVKSISDLKHASVLLVTGIATPEPLLQFLEKESINYSHLEFGDHHHFTSDDILHIQNLSKEKDLILTTEKDYVRLGDALDNVFYLPITTQFLENSSVFNTSIKAYINK